MEFTLQASEEAEKSLLWALLIDKELIAYTLNNIDDNYFYYKNNKFIFQAIRMLASDSKAIDLITVKEKLQWLDIEFKWYKWITIDKFKKENVLAEIWWVSTLVELTETVPTTGNYKEYINIIKEKYRLRQLQSLSDYISSNINNNLDSWWVMSLLETWIKNLNTLTTDDSSISITDAIINRTDELSESLEADNINVVSVKTWMAWIDNLIWPMISWNFITIWASSSIWKSLVALNIMKNNLHNNKRMLFVSMEMKSSEIIDIFISMYTEVKRDRLNRWSIATDQLYDQMNLLKSEEKPYKHIQEQIDIIIEKKTQTIFDIQNSLDEFADKELFINDASSISLEWLKQKIMELTMKEPLDLIIIDHMWLMKWDKWDSTTDRISKLSRWLKQIAWEFNTPVISLVQLLSKQIEWRADRTPLISDIKNSSNVFEDSNVVILLDRPEYWHYKTDPNNAPNQQTMDFYIAKNRRGKLWKISIQVDMAKQLLLKEDIFN